MNMLERKHTILSILKEKNNVAISFLSDLLGVSTVTVRSDLDDLERKGLVFRTHGGACIAERYQDIRKISNTILEHETEKETIASIAATLINPRSTVIIDAGSTTAYLAKHIRNMELTVITNSIPVVQELADASGVELLVSCGALRKPSQSIIGTSARHFFAEVNADMLFLGASGFSLRGGISCTNLVEAETKRFMLQRSMKVCLLADSSKLEKVYMAHLCGWDTIDTFIIDSLPEEPVKVLRDQGVEVITGKDRPPRK